MHEKARTVKVRAFFVYAGRIFYYICVHIFVFMRRIYRYIAAIFSVLALSCMHGCVIDRNESGEALKAGDRIPYFEVVMNDGSTVSSDGLAGSVSCIVFFNSSCPDCRKTLPNVQKLYDNYSRKGVSFAVISRAESYDDVQSYWSENGFEMPFSAQDTRQVYSLFANSGIPRIYISDRDGIIRYVFTDSPVPSYDDLKSSLAALDVE